MPSPIGGDDEGFFSLRYVGFVILICSVNLAHSLRMLAHASTQWNLRFIVRIFIFDTGSVFFFAFTLIVMLVGTEFSNSGQFLTKLGVLGLQGSRRRRSAAAAVAAAPPPPPPLGSCRTSVAASWGSPP